MDTIQVNLDTLNPKKEFEQKFKLSLNEKIEVFEDLYEAKSDWIKTTGLCTKTLDRYRKGSSFPSGDNIIKSYKFIFGNQNQTYVLNNMPDYAIKIYQKQISTKNIKDTKVISDLLKGSSIHYKIFLKSMNGNYINKNDFIRDWGEKKVIPAFDNMVKLNLLVHTEGSFYKRGKINSSFSNTDNYNFFKNLINKEITIEALNKDEFGTQLSLDCYNLSDDGLKDLYDILIDTRAKIYNLEIKKNGTNIVHVGLTTKKSENGVQ